MQQILENCKTCGKPTSNSPSLCVCVQPNEQEPNKTFVLILQHPQEPDKVLGSAPILKSILKNSALVVALSRANLAAALKGTSYKGPIDPKAWAVLYMGTGIIKPFGKQQGVLFQIEGKEKTLKPFVTRSIQGIVVLDGTWSQAKALWWRNPWLLKLQRLVVSPIRPSLYGRLRKEPKKQALSSLESVAFTLEVLESSPSLKDKLLTHFESFLSRAKAAGVKNGRLPPQLQKPTDQPA